MQRKVLGMLLVALATVLLVGIGADFASYTATRSAKIAVVADDQELINLDPGQPYAYISDTDGKLYIDISSTNPNALGMSTGMGISPGSEYDINKVFYVSNNLWEGDATTNKIRVTVTSSNAKIELYSSIEDSTPTYHRDSETAATTITFVVAKGNKGDVGLHLIGPSSLSGTEDGYTPGSPGTISGTITVSAVKVPIT